MTSTPFSSCAVQFRLTTLLQTALLYSTRNVQNAAASIRCTQLLRFMLGRRQNILSCSEMVNDKLLNAPECAVGLLVETPTFAPKCSGSSVNKCMALFRRSDPHVLRHPDLPPTVVATCHPDPWEQSDFGGRQPMHTVRYSEA